MNTKDVIEKLEWEKHRFTPDVSDLITELIDAYGRTMTALVDLHSEVEMGESVGICLRDRVPALSAGQLIAEEGGAP